MIQSIVSPWTLHTVMICNFRLESIDLRFLRSSCGFIINKVLKIWETEHIFYFKETFILKCGYLCTVFVQLSFYCHYLSCLTL